MNNKNDKLAVWVAIIFEIILIITAIVNTLSRQWSNLLLLLLPAACITFPFIISRIANKKNIVLPSIFQLMTLIFILLSLYFGKVLNFYVTFWWWDLFLHGIFGIYGVIVGLHLTQGIIIKNKNVTKKRFTIFTIIFAFTFSITLGTLWEIYEFLGDYFFKTKMANGGLEDTALDLLIKILCALTTSVICYFRNSKRS